jgi:NADH-quinone oxidoreductase subunit E
MLSEAIKAEIESHVHDASHRRSACAEALRIVQRERGWIDDQSLREVAELLEMTPHELDGVATFFNLIHRRPVGRHVVRVCSSVSCWILGYEGVRDALLGRLGVELGEQSADGLFTVLPNQCLGACDRGPVLMVGDDLHTHVDAEKIEDVLGSYRSRAER